MGEFLPLFEKKCTFQPSFHLMKTPLPVLVLLMMCGTSVHLFSQVKIGGNAPQVHPSAVLELESSQAGFLPPRLTQTQISAIANPAVGLMVFNTTTQCHQTFIPPGGWQNMYCGCTAPPTPVALAASSASGPLEWRWQASAGATGYKVHGQPVYANAQDVGNVTQWLQSNVVCNQTDSLYVWAYNACAPSAPLLLTAQPWCPIVATGGTMSQYTGNGSNGQQGVVYRVHRFTQTGNQTFTVQDTGSSSMVTYLLVGGGGGGGFDFAGGGGAGGLLTGNFALPGAQSFTLSVGQGGLGATQTVAQAQSGSPSTAFGFTALGGGAGRSGSGPGCISVAQSGGSGGGGGAWHSCAFPAASGTPGQGHAGGVGTGVDPNIGSRGGGGGGAAGPGVAGGSGGHGGPGLSSSITGTATFYAGGGGGGTWQTSVPGSGGVGGGGNGASGNNASGAAGTPNTGGGGGGSSGGGGGGTGGNGGSGVIIVRYPITQP